MISFSDDFAARRFPQRNSDQNGMNLDSPAFSNYDALKAEAEKSPFYQAIVDAVLQKLSKDDPGIEEWGFPVVVCHDSFMAIIACTDEATATQIAESLYQENKEFLKDPLFGDKDELL